MKKIVLSLLLFVLYLSLVNAVDEVSILDEAVITEPIVVVDTDDELEFDEDIKILPDSPLYGLKRVAEDVRLAFTLDKKKKAEKGLELADKRLAEIQLMTNQGKTKGLEKAQAAHKRALERVRKDIEIIKKVQGEPEEELKTVVELEKKIRKHEDRVLRLGDIIEIKIKTELTADQEEKLRDFLDSLKQDTANARINVLEEREKSKERLRKEVGYTDIAIEKKITDVEVSKGLNLDDKAKAINAIKEADLVIEEAKIRLDKVKDLVCLKECVERNSAKSCADKCLTPPQTSFERMVASARLDMITANVVEEPTTTEQPTIVEEPTTTEQPTINETPTNDTEPPEEPPAAACEDSDGGLEYYTYGKVFTQGNTQPSVIDTCSGSTVNEGICTSDGGATAQRYLCPNGCANGACIEEAPEPIPPTPSNESICDSGETVTICHQPGTNAEQTMIIPNSAVSGHMGHGDTCGECNESEEIPSNRELTFKLTFDDTMTSTDGEAPLKSVGTPIYSTDAISGKSLSNVKSNEYYQYLCEGNFNHEEGTVQAWIKFDRFGRDAVVWHTDDSMYVMYYDKGSRDGYKAIKGRVGQVSPEPRYKFDLRDTPENEPNTWEGTGWHFVAMTWKGSPSGIAKLFIDGELKDTRTYSGGEDCYTFRVGNNYWPGMSWIDGKIDELEVYNYAREPGKILNNYNDHAEEEEPEVEEEPSEPVSVCPSIALPSPNFCKNGRIVPKKDDGCLVGYDCEAIIIPVDTEPVLNCTVECTTDVCNKKCIIAKKDIDSTTKKHEVIKEKLEVIKQDIKRDYEILKEKIIAEDRVVIKSEDTSSLNEKITLAEQSLEEALKIRDEAEEALVWGDSNYAIDAAHRAIMLARKAINVLI
ncbi:hypothetical protein HQ533_04205 [Candidatus Woesearchaeota archaeon]|nr:hypothetical protein [Candidatus Woesearchaeota archaeon]